MGALYTGSENDSKEGSNHSLSNTDDSNGHDHGGPDRSDKVGPERENYVESKADSIDHFDHFKRQESELRSGYESLSRPPSFFSTEFEYGQISSFESEGGKWVDVGADLNSSIIGRTQSGLDLSRLSADLVPVKIRAPEPSLSDHKDSNSLSSPEGVSTEKYNTSDLDKIGSRLSFTSSLLALGTSTLSIGIAGASIPTSIGVVATLGWIALPIGLSFTVAALGLSLSSIVINSSQGRYEKAMDKAASTAIDVFLLKTSNKSTGSVDVFDQVNELGFKKSVYELE